MIGIEDDVAYLGKTVYKKDKDNKPNITIYVNRKILNNPDVLRQTLAHEIIHHHLYHTYGTDVARHGEHFQMIADKINEKEGENFVAPYAEQTEFKSISSTLPLVTIPKNSFLFHGTAEKFSGELKPGIDKLIWFSDSPKIAQLYIPKSGLKRYCDAYDISRPSKDPLDQQIQKFIGIDYDYSEVEWDGNRVKSFKLPSGFDHVPKENEVDELMKKAGIEGDNHRYTIRVSGNKILKTGEHQKGRLYIAEVKEPLTLWRKAKGEGDLMDLQYNDFAGFDAAKKTGIDGVLIDDFAQSEEYGNFGHMSVGLFNTKKLKIHSVPAQYREWEYKAKGTPEYPNPPDIYLHKL